MLGLKHPASYHVITNVQIIRPGNKHSRGHFPNARRCRILVFCQFFAPLWYAFHSFIQKVNFFVCFRALLHWSKRGWKDWGPPSPINPITLKKGEFWKAKMHYVEIYPWKGHFYCSHAILNFWGVKTWWGRGAVNWRSPSWNRENKEDVIRWTGTDWANTSPIFLILPFSISQFLLKSLA